MVRRIAWIVAASAAAASAHGQTVVGPAATYSVRTDSETTIEYGDGFVKISWARKPRPDESVPSPPVVPTPKPERARTADWLILLFDDAAMTPELDGLKQSTKLREGLPGTQVAWFSLGSEGFARFQPYLASKSLTPPVYLYMQGTTVLSFGTITTEAELIKESTNLH
jgi:hypothetical protein